MALQYRHTTAMGTLLTLDRYVRDSTGRLFDMATGAEVELRTGALTPMKDPPSPHLVVERGRDEFGAEYVAIAVGGDAGELPQTSQEQLSRRVAETLDNLPERGVVEIASSSGLNERAGRGAAWVIALEARRAGFVPVCLSGLQRLPSPRLLAGRSIVVIEEPGCANPLESLRRTCAATLAAGALGGKVRVIAAMQGRRVRAGERGDAHVNPTLTFALPSASSCRSRDLVVADRPASGRWAQPGESPRFGARLPAIGGPRPGSARRDRELQSARGAARRRGNLAAYLSCTAELAASRLANLAFGAATSVALEALTRSYWWTSARPFEDDVLEPVLHLNTILARADIETVHLSKAFDTLVPSEWAAGALMLADAEVKCRALLARCQRLAGRFHQAFDLLRDDTHAEIDGDTRLLWMRERLWAAIHGGEWRVAIECATRLRRLAGPEWWRSAVAGDLALFDHLTGGAPGRDGGNVGFRSSGRSHSTLDRARSAAFARLATVTRNTSGSGRRASPTRLQVCGTAAIRVELNQLAPLCRTADGPLHGSAGDRCGGNLRRALGLKEWTMEDLLELVRLCHDTDDEERTLGRVCVMLRDRLGASAVGIWGEASAQPLVGAGTGREWPSTIAGRARATGLPFGPESSSDGIEAAWPVTHGGAPIGAVACRWVVERDVTRDSVAPLLTAASTACAPLVRNHLDRAVGCVAADTFGLVGNSHALVELRAGIQRAAAAPYHVLIEGESGSGKEMVARAVHHASARRQKRFCAINCAALTDELLEAELFGHARGAFTGAIAERAGLFEDASGGTLFLDEVADLSLRGQAKVLRVLQDGEIRRLGENFARRVEVRVVAATNKPLREEAASGRFREDLRYRLDVLRLTVPPLRERREDVPLLVSYFWRDAAARVGSRAVLDHTVITALARYDWPGNVRELQNVIASLAVHAPARGRVGPSALPGTLKGVVQRSPLTTLDAARRQFEAEYVRMALARAGGRRAEAARVLGLTRQGLAKLITRLGVSA